MFSQACPLVLLKSVLAFLVLLVPVTGYSGEGKYPSKAIEFVVAFNPGGGVDAFARATAKYLSAELGVPVNVINKPGGNQIPAVLSVLSAPPDGYTLLCVTGSTSSILMTFKDVPFKISDMAFGPILAGGVQAYLVGKKSPWNSLRDVAEAAKRNPEAFTWTLIGSRSYSTFGVLQFLKEAGVDISKTRAVSFDGAGPAVTSVAGGHVMFSNVGTGTVFPLLKSGDIKVIAVTGAEREKSLPEVPTTKEAGFPLCNLYSWFSIAGHKDLPRHIIETLDRVGKKLTEDPAFRRDMVAQGNEARYMSADKVRPYVISEVETFREIAELIPKK